MTRSPRAFHTLALVLGLWVVGRSAIVAYGHFSIAQALPVKDAVGSVPPLPNTEPALVARAPAVAVDRQMALRVAAFPPQSSSQPEFVRKTENVPLTPSSAVVPSVRSVMLLQAPAAMPPALALGARRQWSASGWLVYRGNGGGSALAPNGQLGGSQAGARIWAGLADLSSSIALGASLRASTALGKVRQREVAPGISVRLGGRFPLEVIAERRFSVGANAPDRFALIGATGVDDLSVPGGLLASGYLQAGVAGLRSRDGFVDGAARVEKPLLEENAFAVRAGANVWGAAQPGVSRVDLGPSVTLKTSTLGTPLRISAEWRQRVAGKAAPGSGPAITVGADF